MSDSIYDSIAQQIHAIHADASLSPQEKAAKKKKLMEVARQKSKEAEVIVRQGAGRAGDEVSARMRPISKDAAVVAKMLVDRGIPPGQAIKAAARVAEWKFLWDSLGPFAADAAALSPAPIQLWRRKIQQEF